MVSPTIFLRYGVVNSEVGVDKVVFIKTKINIIIMKVIINGGVYYEYFIEVYKVLL